MVGIIIFIVALLILTAYALLNIIERSKRAILVSVKHNPIEIDKDTAVYLYNGAKNGYKPYQYEIQLQLYPTLEYKIRSFLWR